MNEKKYNCIKRENILYAINEDEKTVSVYRVERGINEIYIPRSIDINSEDYIVTSILGYAFNFNSDAKSIKFANDSLLQTIEKNALSFSHIEKISFPSSLIKLNDGWNFRSKDLMEINFMPDNPYFKTYDNKYIIGKSSFDSDDYNILVFCSRDIEKAIIPDFIKTIKSYAFYNCQKLREVELSVNSQLKTIEKMAFSKSSIESIYIPPNLIELNKKWCKDTPNLTKIKVDINNPRYKLLNNQILIGKSSIDQENFNTIVCSTRDIETALIPNYIEIIEACAFNKCHQLKDVKIQDSSKLQIIEKYAFEETIIENFIIPPHLKIIGKNSFLNCSQLRNVDITINSEFKTIEKLAFKNSAIEQLVIPASLIELKKGWCKGMTKLSKIDVMPNNPRYYKYNDKLIIGKSSIEQQNYDILMICARNAKSAEIPNFIEIIDDDSFNQCDIHSIEFEAGSKLRIIGEDAFSFSLLRSISIPSTLEKISKNAFDACRNLNNVDISSNSELKIIDERAFGNCSFSNFYIPKHIKIISPSTFISCRKLKKVDFSDNRELQSIASYAFIGTAFTGLYIPKNLKLIYKKTFTHLEIIEFEENYDFENSSFPWEDFNENTIFMVPFI